MLPRVKKDEAPERLRPFALLLNRSRIANDETSNSHYFCDVVLAGTFYITNTLVDGQGDKMYASNNGQPSDNTADFDGFEYQGLT